MRHYIGGEFDNPGRVLPRALITATASVMLLHLLLHVMFLSAAPMEAMVVVEIGYVVAEYTFGVSAGWVIGVILSLLLVSTISAMLLAGPRALYVIGRDFLRSAGLVRESVSRRLMPWFCRSRLRCC